MRLMVIGVIFAGFLSQPIHALEHAESGEESIKLPSIGDLLFEEIQKNGISGARRLFAKQRAAKFEGVHATAGSLNFLASAYLFRFDQPSTARQLLMWSLDIDHSNPETELKLAQLEYLSGNRRAALRHYNKAISLRGEWQGRLEYFDRLANDDAPPPESDRLHLLLSRAGRYKGIVQRVPIAITSIRKKLDAFIVRRSPGLESRGGELTKMYLDVLDVVQSEEQERQTGTLRESAVPSVSSAVLSRDYSYTVGRQLALDAMRDLSKPIIFKTSTIDGEKIEFGPGDPTLLVFFKTDGSISGASIPGIIAFAKRYASHGLRVVGVVLDGVNEQGANGDLDRVRDTVRQRVWEMKIDWPIIFDGLEKGGELARKAFVRGTPRLVLLDKQGIPFVSQHPEGLQRLDDVIEFTMSRKRDISSK